MKFYYLLFICISAFFIAGCKKELSDYLTHGSGEWNVDKLVYTKYDYNGEVDTIITSFDYSKFTFNEDNTGTYEIYGDTIKDILWEETPDFYILITFAESNHVDYVEIVENNPDHQIWYTEIKDSLSIIRQKYDFEMTPMQTD